MPQRSYGFAIGQVRALEGTLLGFEGSRLISGARSMGDLAHLLRGWGWGEADSLADIKRLCDERTERAENWIRRNSPEPEITGCFLLKRDAVNLKLLHRARRLKKHAVRISRWGEIEPGILARAVSEGDYALFPPLIRNAMVEIEACALMDVDPMRMDACIDRALFGVIMARLRGRKRCPIRRFFIDGADLTNLKTALRCAKMRIGRDLAEKLMLCGGAISARDVVAVADNPADAVPLSAPHSWGYLVRESLARGLDDSGLLHLEAGIEPYLFNIVSAHRTDTDGLMPLVTYLLECEADARRVWALAVQLGAGQG